MFTSCWLAPARVPGLIRFLFYFPVIAQVSIAQYQVPPLATSIAISPSGVRTSSWNRPVCMLTLTSTFPPYLSLLSFVELHLTVGTRIALLRLHTIAVF